MTQENPIYSSDLAGVVVGETAISDVQGDTGVLSYRGIDINDLVDAPYLHVVWMVLFGDWPNEQQKSRLKSFMCRHTRLSYNEIELLQHVPRDLHPMLMLQGLVPLLDLPQEETLGAGLDAEHGLFLIWSGQGGRHRVVWCDHHVRRAKQRIRPGGEHAQLLAQRGNLEVDLGALAAADPVALQVLDVLGPVQVVQVVQQALGVGRDLEHPLLSPNEVFLAENEVFSHFKRFPRVELQHFEHEDKQAINFATEAPPPLTFDIRAAEAAACSSSPCGSPRGSRSSAPSAPGKAA